MTIKIKNYEITPSIGINLFDISKIDTFKNGKLKGERREIVEAYGVKLERCFRIILDGLVEDELKDSTINLEKYLEIYQNINKELLKEVQQLGALLSNK